MNRPASKCSMIFVHGINGHRERTWIGTNANKEAIFWPHIFLGEDFPEARILTWGYDAKVDVKAAQLNRETVMDHATTLLRDIEADRYGNVPQVLYTVLRTPIAA